ncbi:unnamed protein product [Bursaphelenchus okinawaensis]|uniref:Growth hormone-inducible transmembrane protein n=1 Tax=Bursaphelenchus okinawaensis TaxID=465554 RepID=A0A811KC57_9BILA|nr:unnamed protein product [Bursaphelenchus okinawaensis]CAG9097701.1 unnamed protein product [Bursaphelenchus okinawaensis]
MLSRLAMFGGRVAVPSVARNFHVSAKQAARFEGNRFTQYTFGTKTKAGPTLRERLLGPTTGKPFLYGTYAIAGASVFGVGMLCYYGAGMSKGLSAMDRAALWPEHVRQRLQTTYAYLAGSLALTAAAGVAAARTPAILALTSGGGLLVFAGSMAAIIGTGMLVRSIDYDNNKMAKILMWAAHCGVMGAVLAPLCFAGGPVLMRAAWYTAGLVGGLSATAMFAPSEKFLMWSGPLAMGLGVVFVANIGSLFFPANTALGAGLASIVVYGGLILFSMFLLYDTQRIIKKAEFQPFGGVQTYYNQYGQPVQEVRTGGYDPINAQLSLYMDILNIFIRMVMITGGGNQRRK